jgi:uncharacterized membrane protein YkvA (DUF1232 family)
MYAEPVALPVTARSAYLVRTVGEGQWWSGLAGVLGGLLVLWIVLVVGLWLLRPARTSVRDVLRLLPDLVRLLRRLARDSTLPRGIRLRLWLLLGYLALPFDLIPDVVPVVGYADDAMVVVLTLRSVIRTSGFAAARHEPKKLQLTSRRAHRARPRGGARAARARLGSAGRRRGHGQPDRPVPSPRTACRERSDRSRRSPS